MGINSWRGFRRPSGTRRNCARDTRRWKRRAIVRGPSGTETRCRSANPSPVPEGPLKIARQFHWRDRGTQDVNRVPEGRLNLHGERPTSGELGFRRLGDVRHVPVVLDHREARGSRSSGAPARPTGEGVSAEDHEAPRRSHAKRLRPLGSLDRSNIRDVPNREVPSHTVYL